MSFVKTLRPGAGVDLWREQNAIAMMQDLQRIPGPVYSESTTILMKSGREIFAEPFMITMLANSHIWDQTRFVRKISSKFFSAIVISSSLDNRGRFTPEVSNAIKQYYVLDRSHGNYYVYVPKS